MTYKGLRDFIQILEEQGELKRIRAEVDPVLEITEITDRVSKAHGPALLFEKVKGSEYPVLMNAFGSERRMGLALGKESIEAAASRVGELLEMIEKVPGATWGERLKMIPQYLPKVLPLARIMPRVVSDGACQEVVEMEPDLAKLPVLQCWPGDAGRFITLPQVFTRNPKTGMRNVGMYRLQVFDKNTTGMHWHIHHDGANNYRLTKEAGKERIEVAVALGGDPAVTYAATAPLPRDLDELLLAGFFRGKGVELVKCKTVDLEVPADADFILEGYVEMDERRLEGPFGDHTGYYSLAGMYPVFHLTCLTHRKDAVYPATIVGRPPMEDCYMALATERIFLPVIRMQLPEIQNLHMPMEGVFHNCVCVSIKKEYPYQARKVMNALWGLGQMMFAKFIIVVDDDVNVMDNSEVLWKVFNNVDPKRDLTVTEGPLEVLDHSAPLPLFGAKIGIDATRKGPEEGHEREWPEDIRMTEKIKRKVEERWKEYGFA